MELILVGGLAAIMSVGFVREQEGSGKVVACLGALLLLGGLIGGPLPAACGVILLCAGLYGMSYDESMREARKQDMEESRAKNVAHSTWRELPDGSRRTEAETALVEPERKTP